MPRAKSAENRDRMIHVRLSDSTHKRLRVHVAEWETTIQDWVEALIEKQLPVKQQGLKKNA